MQSFYGGDIRDDFYDMVFEPLHDICGEASYWDIFCMVCASPI
jgi:hypothetical protein